MRAVISGGTGLIDHALSSTHRNNFVAVVGATTKVVVWMEAQLRPRLLWGIAGLTMWLGMPELAGFRGWLPQSLPKGTAK